MNVKELREARGWSQMELAMKMGCTVRAVQYWETGHNIPETKMKRLEAVFSGKESGSTTSKAVNHSTSVAAAPNATVNVNSQATLERILDEMVGMRKVVENQLSTKDNQIDRLLGLLEGGK